MRMRITFKKKKSDPEKFAIPCTVKGIEFPHVLCDTGASVKIIPRVMADHLGLQVEPSQELFTFVDCSQKNSGGIVRDLEVQIVGAVCNLQTNQLCLTLIDPNAHYDPIPVKKPQTIPRRINDPGIIAACHCGAEYESDYSESIDTHPVTSIDTQPQQRCRKRASTDTAYYKSVDTDFNRVRDGDYSIVSWADKNHHESFAVETVTYTPGADKLQDSFTDEELLNMQKRDDTDQIQAEAAWERTHFSQSIDTRHQQSIDTLPQQSIDTNNTTSIDNRPIPKTTVSEQDKLDNQYLTPNEFGIFSDPYGHAKSIDGRTLHVSQEDIADIF
ncbi:hypothetical protein F2Q69_00048294 [Brassica cretica]|uniref:Aspartic peptidase DDI1-type domain-containing protein n=1 Tax=Brassica cretica TaxID=69181 RepID=A0A8S9PLB5_BRACR|nr:hypothetical protein F2Q69_00048294 [Brassica cretica]